MLIYIAGVCHHDPKGKDNLTAWLHKLSADYDEPPAFAGVEYDKVKFAQVKRQRPMLRQRIKSTCPRATSDLLDALTDCLAYEPDAVADVFPDVERFWLDAGIPASTANVYEMWVVYYKQYKTSLDSRGVLFPVESAEALSLLSATSWDLFNGDRLQFPDPGDALRSESFARGVLDRINQERARWAIVIVGAYHASGSIRESMRSRLTDAGIECEACWIKPNGAVLA